MKAASNSNMAGVSAAAAGQEIFVEGKGSTRQRPQGFVVQNRFNYLTAGKKMLQKCSMIGLTTDAVSVGQDHILNVFLWNPDKKEAYLGPPQAVCLTCPISTRSEARMNHSARVPLAVPGRVLLHGMPRALGEVEVRDRCQSCCRSNGHFFQKSACPS